MEFYKHVQLCLLLNEQEEPPGKYCYQSSWNPLFIEITLFQISSQNIKREKVCAVSSTFDFLLLPNVHLIILQQVERFCQTWVLALRILSKFWVIALLYFHFEVLKIDLRAIRVTVTVVRTCFSCRIAWKYRAFSAFEFHESAGIWRTRGLLKVWIRRILYFLIFNNERSMGGSPGDVSEELCSFYNLSVTSPTSQLILQPIRRFTYVTAHSPTFPLLHLRHSSFSNLSVASPTSQLILQLFFRFS